MNDLLLALPSYSATSQRGHELLKILLDKADISLREEARSAMPSLKTSRPLLDSAFSVAVRRQAAPPADLLRFHCQLFERADLSKWPQSDRVYLIERTVETLAACEDEHTRHSSSSKAQISALREQFVTISPTVLEVSENTFMLPEFVSLILSSSLRGLSCNIQNCGELVKSLCKHVCVYGAPALDIVSN